MNWWLTFSLLCLSSSAVRGQNEAPEFTHDMNNYEVSENTELGVYIYQIEGRDPEGQPVRAGIQSDVFLVRNENEGLVYLQRLLNYEREKSFQVLVWISDGENRVERNVTVRVKDENDVPPQFNQNIYQTSIREDVSVGYTVFKDVVVTDEDTVNSDISVTCVNKTDDQFRESCDMFTLVMEEQSSQTWRGHVILQQPMDRENRGLYQLHVRAWDGVNEADQSMEISIQDVQDTPPRFTSGTTAVIKEGLLQGNEILTVTATDGDGDASRIIRYSLVDDAGGLFQIDKVSGRITSTRDINREDPVLGLGFVNLKVKASEMLNSTIVSTDPMDVTEVQVTITIEDVNDNKPTFDRTSYTVDIREDILEGSAIAGLALSVTDNDQGSNSVFELRLANDYGVFDVFPTSGSRSLSATVRIRSSIANSNKIDYDEGIKRYNLRVIAQETRSPDRFSSEAAITVNVMDINDNAPEFAQDSYTVSISETAVQGTVVTRITATDKDSGMMGQQGIRYRLVGNGAEKFRTDPYTGEITVARCNQPGSGNCLDFEQQQSYPLTLQARDLGGEGITVSTRVTINLLDENDNPPIFELPNYISYIKEGTTVPDPSIQVKAIDKDTSRNENNRIQYYIVGGNQNGLFQIGRTSGVITGTRPVSYRDTPNQGGSFYMTVQAADPRYSTTANVQIIVQDTNDHTPVFPNGGYYETSIPETTPPGTNLLQVAASDNDPNSSPNGQVKYIMLSGSQSKFNVDENTGSITVAQLATFDYDTQNRYQMLVIGADQGNPSRSATATVVVNILDRNNKMPYFQPTTVRRQVAENVSINHQVVQMQATDPDATAQLYYVLDEPKQAWSPNGQPLQGNAFNHKDMLSIERNTGVVRVHAPLNYDNVARLSVIVKAIDSNSAGPGQTATATLIVDVQDVNTNAPEFQNPWTPSNPYLQIQVQEEQPPGFYVTTIVATDPPAGTISQYRIISDPGQYFNINPNTGVVTLAKSIDYEQVQKTQFVVVAMDNEQPPLTSTATVQVDIININDMSPEFQQSPYEVLIPENSPGGRNVVKVTATDGDRGDFGIVFYQLQDPSNRFDINRNTGEVTIKPGADLDYEKEQSISLNVQACDSPNTPAARRCTPVSVVVTLADDNDNRPDFTQQNYYKQVVETAPPGQSVIQITATDKDNDKIIYVITAGNNRGFFKIDENTGLITVNSTLRGSPGTYNITVKAYNPGKPNFGSTAYIQIEVIPSSNTRPVWVTPSIENDTASVLEEQYKGLIFLTVEAQDGDPGANGLITYGFRYNGQFVPETPNFKINQVTGVIQAKNVLDRETRDTYTVVLVARDNGFPPLESERFLTIIVKDIDDHIPKFPLHQNCCAIPVIFHVDENAAKDMVLGDVKATDLDQGQNAAISYSIVGGNTDEAFGVNASTGAIYVKGNIDYERQSVYQLTVRASNTFGSLLKYTAPQGCKCADPSVITVYVYVRDINDFPPAFQHQVYNTCLPMNTGLGREVIQLEAVDRDLPPTSHIVYDLYDIRTFLQLGSGPLQPGDNAFRIGSKNGSITSNTLMVRYEDHYFLLSVEAADNDRLSSVAQVRVFITKPAQELKLTFKQKREVVRQNLDATIQRIQEILGGGIVCVAGVKYHVGTDGNINFDWTDLFLYIVNGTTLVVIPPGETGGIIGSGLGLDADVIGAVGTGFSAFVIDPVVAALAIILALIILALLILCCLCCCFKGLFEKDEYVSYAHPLFLNGTINPIWHDKMYEDQELTMNMQQTETAEMLEIDAATRAKLAESGIMNVQLANGRAGVAADSTDGAAKLTLQPGMEVTRETKTETEYKMTYERTGNQQSSGAITDGAGGVHIQTGIGGSSHYGSASGNTSPKEFHDGVGTHAMGRSGLIVGPGYMVGGGGGGVGGGAHINAGYAYDGAEVSWSPQLSPVGHGPARIGARLQGSQLVYEDGDTSLPQVTYTTLPQTQHLSHSMPSMLHDYYTEEVHGENTDALYRAHSGNPLMQPHSLQDNFPQGFYQGEIRLNTMDRPHAGVRHMSYSDDYHMGGYM